jgi:hypothetical protein
MSPERSPNVRDPDLLPSLPSLWPQVRDQARGQEGLGFETLREERIRPEVSGGSFSAIHTVVREDTPAIVDVQEFRYRYKCNHCGHEWSEVHEKVHEVDEPKS